MTHLKVGASGTRSQGKPGEGVRPEGGISGRRRAPPVIVLDTNVLSELARPEPNAAVLAWVATPRYRPSARPIQSWLSGGRMDKPASTPIVHEFDQFRLDKQGRQLMRPGANGEAVPILLGARALDILLAVADGSEKHKQGPYRSSAVTRAAPTSGGAMPAPDLPTAFRARRSLLSHTTPLSRSRFSSSAPTPHNEPSTSSVCSPNSGGRVTSAGESDSLIGQPTVW